MIVCLKSDSFFSWISSTLETNSYGFLIANMPLRELLLVRVLASGLKVFGEDHEGWSLHSPQASTLVSGHISQYPASFSTWQVTRQLSLVETGRVSHWSGPVQRSARLQSLRVTNRLSYHTMRIVFYFLQGSGAAGNSGRRRCMRMVLPPS